MAIYGSLEGANQYHEARGNAAWAEGAEAARAAALVRATQYIDGRYRVRYATGRWASTFPGEKTQGRSQELEWPRTGATDYDGNDLAADAVPIEVEQATYEAALRELANPGSLSPDFTPSTLVTREKVGPIEVEYQAGQGADPLAPNRPVIPAIDELIAPVLLIPARLPGVAVV